jgi:hypothetical protein
MIADGRVPRSRSILLTFATEVELVERIVRSRAPGDVDIRLAPELAGDAAVRALVDRIALEL